MRNSLRPFFLRRVGGGKTKLGEQTNNEQAGVAAASGMTDRLGASCGVQLYSSNLGARRRQVFAVAAAVATSSFRRMLLERGRRRVNQTRH